MKPIVGINCDYEDDTKPHSFAYRDYVDAILMAGGIPFCCLLLRTRKTWNAFWSGWTDYSSPAGMTCRPPATGGKE